MNSNRTIHSMKKRRPGSAASCFSAACSSAAAERPDFRSSAAPTSGRLRRRAEPALFAPGIVSTGFYERDLAVSPGWNGDLLRPRFRQARHDHAYAPRERSVDRAGDRSVRPRSRLLLFRAGDVERREAALFPLHASAGGTGAEDRMGAIRISGRSIAGRTARGASRISSTRP